jgi:hypothetical protein
VLRIDKALPGFRVSSSGFLGVNAGLYGSAQVRLGGGTRSSNPACSSAESAANPVQLIEWRGFQRTSVASVPLRELWGEPSNLARHLNLRARSAPARPGAAVNRGIQQWLDVIWFGNLERARGFEPPTPTLTTVYFSARGSGRSPSAASAISR